MVARLILAGTSPTTVTREAIAAALADAGIAVTPEVERRVEEIVEAAQFHRLPAEPPVIAEGQAPIEGTPAGFEPVADLLADAEPGASPDDEFARVDFYRSQIITVAADQAIGSLIPAVPSSPGVDVFGQPVAPGRSAPPVQLGANVRLGENGQTVIAVVAGKVRLTPREISVVESVEIAGDVDFSTGSIQAATDVLVKGTVRDLFKVSSHRGVAVRGAVEAAEVQAGTDVQINGGVASRGLGCIVAGGDIFTKYCNEADLRAQGDICITREAMNSRIYTCGRLRIERGALIGGRAYAREGAQIHEIGNEADTRTEIAIGIDPKLYAEARNADEVIRRKQEAVSRIRGALAPLMAQLQRLAPAQREKVAELMDQAGSLETEIGEHEAVRQRVFAARSRPGDEPALTVTRMLYAGVSVIFGDKITTVSKPRKGPIKIVRRLHDRVEEILLIDQVSGSVTILNSREYRPEPDESAPSH